MTEALKLETPYLIGPITRSFPLHNYSTADGRVQIRIITEGLDNNPKIEAPYCTVYIVKCEDGPGQAEVVGT